MVGSANEWIIVEMGGGKRVPYVRLEPLVIFGKLTVEPEWNGTALVGLYKISGEFFLPYSARPAALGNGPGIEKR
jgi:hypothetical protein